MNIMRSFYYTTIRVTIFSIRGFLSKLIILNYDWLFNFQLEKKIWVGAISFLKMLSFLPYVSLLGWWESASTLQIPLLWYLNPSQEHSPDCKKIPPSSPAGSIYLHSILWFQKIKKNKTESTYYRPKGKKRKTIFDVRVTYA